MPLGRFFQLPAAAVTATAVLAASAILTAAAPSPAVADTRAALAGEQAMAVTSAVAAPAEAPAPPPAETGAARPEGFSLTYNVYTGGFRAIRLDFDLAVDNADVIADAPAYATNVRMETSGLIGFMFGWRFDARADGAWRDGHTVPLRYHTANVWKGNERSVSIDYEDGVAREVSAQPPYSAEDMKKVTAAQRIGAVDPTSAVTALVLTSALQGECRPTTAIYDGRRRYDALMTPLEPQVLKQSSQAPYAGPAEGCKLTFKRIAGFNPEKKRMQDLEVDIWLAEIGAGPGRLPVRLELSTPWGNGFAHLVRARDAAGTLVFGKADD